MTASGTRTKWVTLTKEGPAVPDGDGSFTNPPVALDPPGVFASIEPASARTLERVTAGTVASSATHIVKMPYHAGVSVDAIVQFGEQTFKVTSVRNPGMRNRETIAVCVEQL